MAQVLQTKVVSVLPGTLVANTIYYVRVRTGFDMYITNNSGTVVAFAHNAQMNYYNASGQIDPPRKKWESIITPTSAQGLVVDISSAGFSSVLSIQAIAIKDSTNANDCLNVSVKSYTNSQLVLNIVQGNNAVVAILGINVLSGSPLAFPSSLTGVKLSVVVEGY